MGVTVPRRFWGEKPQLVMRKIGFTGWLAEVVRPKRAPVPWADMLRAVLAICLPLSVAFAIGRETLGVLPSIGGLLGTMADTGGTYLTRVKRVSSATVLGGAVGLTIGAVIHGHGWVAVFALVVVAAVSGVLSSMGDIGSSTGLQLLVYTGLGLGPVGAERPVWHTAAGFLVGAAWALLLILPGWLLSPYGKEQRSVAAVYDALAVKFAAIGTTGFAAARQGVTTAMNTAYDELLSVRAVSGGRNKRAMRLIAMLNASHRAAEASTALGVAGDRPPPIFIDVLRRMAAVIREGGTAPFVPPAWDTSVGTVALRDALVNAARVLSPTWTPSAEPGLTEPAAPVRETLGRRVTTFVNGVLDGFGRVNRIFTVRLMACILMAGVVTEVLRLPRSYWVPLTVAIVFKPDYGSVFARALQRGIGTVVGAVLGAVLLVLVHGEWLLIPFAVLAALLPFGRARNYGLLATFLTPLVVVLIDLLRPAGWQLAEDRLVDTLIGCAIVLVIGFAPWWTVWYVHVPQEFSVAAGKVCDFFLAALGGADSSASVSGSASASGAVLRLRREGYRALADLRAEFQRTMSEPPSISRRASAWWPAVVGLEQVMDAVTALALSVRKGAAAPSPEAVQAASSVLREACSVAAAGEPLDDRGLAARLPGDEALAGVTGAVQSLLGVLSSSEDRLTV
jgi:uncharacterized membrane protein YccC